MRISKMIDIWMLRWWPRYRLWRIQDAIGIRLYKWQKQFALGKLNYIPLARERGGGKTTAVMVRILMIPTNNAYSWGLAGYYLHKDHDWQHDRTRWYSGEYRRLRDLCLDAGIPVLRVEIYRMIEMYEKHF